MATTDYDVITMGGGLGGASIAKVLAEKGWRVLVTEREETFKDRIRGEFLAPWGVAEAQKLGLYELLMEKCAHEQPFIIFGGVRREYRTTTPQQLPALTFFHATMQEMVLEAAQRAGAEVRRGVNVKQVRWDNRLACRLKARRLRASSPRASSCVPTVAARWDEPGADSR